MDEQHIVFIGGGPRTAMILERISANREHFPGSPLRLHIVDPYPAGAGRIWRENQSPLLKLNSRASDVSMFTDESVQCLGPAVNGPPLDEWARLIREGALNDAPQQLASDPLLRAEVAALGPEDFPTRRLQSCYLRWFFDRVRASFAAPDQVEVHLDTAVDLISGPSAHQVHLASGQIIEADQVVLVQGHLDARIQSDARAAEFAAKAAKHQHLGYFPPGYTNDIDFQSLPAGADVLVSGMGLAFTDLFVLLFEGRGGRFEPASDGALRYIPSGAEPRLLAGSRRGVPYHSKISSIPRSDTSSTRFFTEEQLARLHERHGELDFFEHVWPLIAKEAAYFYYRELFSAPAARTGSFEDFADAYESVHWYSPERASLVARFFEPADRLEFEELDFPLPFPRPFGSKLARTHINRLVTSHIIQDLRLRDSPDHPQFQALFLGLLRCYTDLRFIHDKLSEQGRSQLASWWHGFFSFIDSGPPAHRLRELLALHDAGLIEFLGPETSFGFDEQAQQFTAQTLAGTVNAQWFIEARLPATRVASSADPLLAALHRRGLITEEPGGSGKLHINSLRQVIGPDGAVHRWLFAVGASVSGIQGGAFSRPKSNSAPFADSDALAREVLSAPARMSPWELAGSVGDAHRILG
ncbi:adenylate cyclase [Glutamicibacter uratoxydans]|uniref:Adenylate cyclase n=1 Tax=Glutamicibacter uratoxydans TaxID=43667 RepID=A0A4Y4DMV7_GLUUR|nr:FAD/NAD(P)-binding protein [Glutamicibacter uratoxydans]GED05214.1 adenylate cyclase [Glutamicibacter uratoxydans]